MGNRSQLVKMRIQNIGCIGQAGVELALDNIVCLVGPNNSGKSTVLRAYEAAVSMSALKAEEINADARGQPAAVELWVHIPQSAGNVDEKWKEPSNGLLLVRSRWEWPATGGKPTRSTWDPVAKEYAEDGKAAGLDTVFSSRLPKPFRIGSLENPEGEHKELLDLVLEPIKNQLAQMLTDKQSELRMKLNSLREEAEKPVEAFRTLLKNVERRVSESYASVFTDTKVHLSVSLGDLTVDPGAALTKASGIEIQEAHGQTRWDQQGTGSQRTLFWSMLEVRSELNRAAGQRRETEKELKRQREKAVKAKNADVRQKCEDEIRRLEADLAKGDQSPQDATDMFLPGYMLLIDEPEIALHRAARDHLYSLAEGSGWQVMLSTHHPAFVDPLRDHTTIVRFERPRLASSPHVYRADEMNFSADERENLRALLTFDPTVAEMFFAPRVIVVEGDTEYACFGRIMDDDPSAYPVSARPLIVRARGKATIATIARMLTHFKVHFAVLHDIDSPRSQNGARKNPAFAVNRTICEAVRQAREAGLNVIHSCSCPEFEREHGMDKCERDKPFAAWKAIGELPDSRASVTRVLNFMVKSESTENDSRLHCYEARLQDWVKANVGAVADDPAFGGDN